MYFTANEAAPVNGHASFLAQAAQSAIHDPGANRAEWDKCMAEYLRTRALVMAAFDYGPLTRSLDDLEWLETNLTAQFGRDFRTQPEAASVWGPAMAKHNELDAEMTKRYIEPHWNAQRALVACPAPDLAAALFKADMAAIDDLFRDGGLAGDAFEYVAADLERLA